MITLPNEPGPSSIAPALTDFGGFLTPGLGGRVQRVNRMGSRFALAVTMPPLRSTADGMKWVSRLVRGKSEGVRMEVPLGDFDPGLTGNPVVAGSGQSGSVLNVSGFAPGYYFQEGQWFTLASGGEHFLHQVALTGTASGQGAAALPIYPMLRVEPQDGDVLLFDQPIIEGFVHGDELRWQMSVERLIGIEFEVHERA